LKSSCGGCSQVEQEVTDLNLEEMFEGTRKAACALRARSRILFECARTLVLPWLLDVARRTIAATSIAELSSCAHVVAAFCRLPYPHAASIPPPYCRKRSLTQTHPPMHARFRVALFCFAAAVFEKADRSISDKEVSKKKGGSGDSSKGAPDIGDMLSNLFGGGKK
jgi:hypothetical protein